MSKAGSPHAGTFTYMMYRPARRSPIFPEAHFKIYGANQDKVRNALMAVAAILFFENKMTLNTYNDFAWNLARHYTIRADLGFRILPQSMVDYRSRFETTVRKALKLAHRQGGMSAQTFADCQRQEDEMFGCLHPDNLRLIDDQGRYMYWHDNKMTLCLFDEEIVHQLDLVVASREQILRIIALDLDIFCFQVALDQNGTPVANGLEHAVFGRVLPSGEFEAVVTMLDSDHPAVIEDLRDLYDDWWWRIKTTVIMLPGMIWRALFPFRWRVKRYRTLIKRSLQPKV